MSAVDERLAAVRGDSRKRVVAIGVGAVVGLALAQFHWLGFVVGGMLVALPTRSLPRALAAGLAFGVLAWLGFAVLLALHGSLDGYLGTGQLLFLSVAIPIGGGALGSLVRGVV